MVLSLKKKRSGSTDWLDTFTVDTILLYNIFIFCYGKIGIYQLEPHQIPAILWSPLMAGSTAQMECLEDTQGQPLEALCIRRCAGTTECLQEPGLFLCRRRLMMVKFPKQTKLYIYMRLWVHMTLWHIYTYIYIYILTVKFTKPATGYNISSTYYTIF